MNATFRIPDNAFAKTFAKWQAVTGKTAGQLLHDRAGMLGRYMAASTQPVLMAPQGTPKGGTSNEKKIGQWAVKGDMNRVTSDLISWLFPRPARGHPGKLVLARNEKGKRGSHYPDGEEVGDRRYVYLVEEANFLQDGTTVHFIHENQRNARGRVPFKRRYISKAGLKKKETEDTEKKVGLAKSGWIAAARQISSAGFSGVPVWIQQQAPAAGFGRFDGERPFIRLTNGVRFADAVLRPEYAARAVQGFMSSLVKDMNAQIRHLLK